MICGHLNLDLVSLADELLAGGDEPAGSEMSAEQMIGDAREPSEVLHVLV